MTITILAFGIARDLFGDRTIKLDLKGGETVAEVMSLLKDRYEGLKQLKSVVLAVNEDYVEDDYQIKSGDELAIIPPVSGG
ncbi:molybdopterin converting factor subunit 1 [Reichenbachiella ulvae]|uniref:Molybdopterin synthase sulfur carrier subunit n=1 Tax=Reichenbachiella ulvae TaxID=2980104 RepID=A0ABT3CTK9_9BACT|nr:molybdopterin converting factor subunit 1 [Reichenbachiella ulvae]MCV9386932.1 molybdopterin converting factor subunit 1 [Reichenbachiella ulvae]